MLARRLHLQFRRTYSNVITSPVGQLEFPRVTIDEFSMECWSKWEDKTAIECGLSGKRLTYKELRSRSKSFGCSLAQLGFTGKTALFMLPNCPEFPLALLGALRAGMTVSAANPFYTPSELRHQAVDASARCVVTAPESLAQVLEAVGDLDMAVICTGSSLQEGIISFEQMSNIQDPQEELLPKEEDKLRQLALLPYSSGTTGLPKGVRLSHANITTNIAQVNHPQVNVHMDTTDSHQDVVPGVLPFSHGYGTTVVMLRSLRVGAKIISLPRFHPEAFLRILANNKDIVLQGVPTVVNFLATDPRVKTDMLEGLRVTTSGGAPSNPGDLERLREKRNHTILQAFLAVATVIAGCIWVVFGECFDRNIGFEDGAIASKALAEDIADAASNDAYGMTEASPVLTLPKANTGDSLTIGPPLPGTSGKVVDPGTGTALPHGLRGELCFRGPQVMECYHNNPKATAETLDSEGWLHTGDIGYADENGNFFVVDRLKELIKVKGFQVAPAELEALLRQHPQIADAAVTSQSCSRSGEVPVAFLVPAAGSTLDIANVNSWIGSKVADYKRPGRLLVIDKIPKSALGKIQRRRLKEMAALN